MTYLNIVQKLISRWRRRQNIMPIQFEQRRALLTTASIPGISVRRVKRGVRVHSCDSYSRCVWRRETAVVESLRPEDRRCVAVTNGHSIRLPVRLNLPSGKGDVVLPRECAPGDRYIRHSSTVWDATDLSDRLLVMPIAANRVWECLIPFLRRPCPPHLSWRWSTYVYSSHKRFRQISNNWCYYNLCIQPRSVAV